VAQFLGKPDMCQVRVRARHECNWLIPGASGLQITAKDAVGSSDMESSAMVPKDPLTPDKYKERATILQYSLTFSGAAVAFLVTGSNATAHPSRSSNTEVAIAALGRNHLLGICSLVSSHLVTLDSAPLQEVHRTRRTCLAGHRLVFSSPGIYWCYFFDVLGTLAGVCMMDGRK